MAFSGTGRGCQQTSPIHEARGCFRSEAGAEDIAQAPSAIQPQAGTLAGLAPEEDLQRMAYRPGSHTGSGGSGPLAEQKLAWAVKRVRGSCGTPAAAAHTATAAPGVQLLLPAVLPAAGSGPQEDFGAAAAAQPQQLVPTAFTDAARAPQQPDGAAHAAAARPGAALKVQQFVPAALPGADSAFEEEVSEAAGASRAALQEQLQASSTDRECSSTEVSEMPLQALSEPLRDPRVWQWPCVPRNLSFQLLPGARMLLPQRLRSPPCHYGLWGKPVAGQI
jgi:hypothetical protein